ncbi:MAG TPA: diacylglycerol kinase family protein [Polaromonas sp.]|uniref:diacylglycerol/lipid kinase family protein n=1 Tax=Polaromonas sp. TaxID=1869339 RepID=UPI002D3EE8C3|nr:diacylglycerol kinase family protein [Polaromonas sp.]HYW58798.1 diacylglycerol kinase family protein [Polaromonas sp.]
MTSSEEQAQTAARRGPLFIVHNAGAGAKDAQEEHKLIAEVFTEAGREFEFLPVADPSQITQVAHRAVELARARGGVVVAAGGDGTINAVAGAVLGSGCPFGVLPQGTFNYFGRANAIPQDARAAATALLGASISPVQVGQVNGRSFLVNASLGLYPQLLEDREAWKAQWGRSRFVAFISGIATLLQWGQQLRLRIESGDKVAEFKTPTLFIGNNHLQLDRVGIEEAHVNALEHGRLTGVAVRPIGTLALFGLLVRGLLGRLGDAENVDSFTFRRLTVTPRGLRRVKVATDGEIVWMQSPLVFQVADEPLLLLVPAPADRAEVA